MIFHVILHRSSTSYPRMKLRICAPLELVNMLPYDFSYKIYDRDIKQEYSGVLQRDSGTLISTLSLEHPV